VTGASKGIGAAIARALGAEGASVVVNYANDRKGAEATAAAIVEAGGNAITVQGDVAKADDVKRLFDEGERAFGKLDVLVNNAGVFKFSPITEVTEEEFHRQYNTNVWGLLQTTREALPHLKDGSSVINISSIVSRMGIPGSTIYAGTKVAVDTITQVLASELGPRKIRVNSINPGIVESEGTHTAGFIGGEHRGQRAAWPHRSAGRYRQGGGVPGKR